MLLSNLQHSYIIFSLHYIYPESTTNSIQNQINKGHFIPQEASSITYILLFTLNELHSPKHGKLNECV